MGVTAIKTFVNRTNELVEIVKREDPNDSVTLKPNASLQEDVWLPWVTNQAEFDKKAMVITYTESNKVFYVWQHGDKVRYSKTGWEDQGKAIPGISKVDGDRTMVIEAGFPSLEL